MPHSPGNESHLIISFLTLRKLIGILGMGLPFVMALGGWIVVNELSAEGAVIPDEYHPVFWLETVANVSFGFSWIVKGETILRDEGD